MLELPDDNQKTKKKGSVTTSCGSISKLKADIRRLGNNFFSSKRKFSESGIIERAPLTFTGTTRKRKLVENKLDEENDLFFVCSALLATNYVVCRLMNFSNFLEEEEEEENEKSREFNRFLKETCRFISNKLRRNICTVFYHSNFGGSTED